MKQLARIALFSTLLITVPFAWSQTPAETSPPKVLVIQREFVKPGRTGSMHAKTESAYVRAMASAHWPTHYVGMDSMSGLSRSLFFVSYDSFEAWEKDLGNMDKNATLSAAWDKAGIVDGDLLSSFDQSVWSYRPDLSLNKPIDVATMRFFEILQYKVKPGHQSEFAELAKMFVGAYGKEVPNENWAVYQSQYGTDLGDTYLVLFPRRSLAEVDKTFDEDSRVMNTLGAKGQKHLEELMSDCVLSEQTNVFHFNPRLSYVDERWISTDPGFWKPKTMVAARPAPDAKTPAAQ